MQRIGLTDGWQLKQIPPCAVLPTQLLDEARSGSGDGWLPIHSMPRMVHSVLIDHGIIEQPWLPGQAEACLWVAEQDWVYACRFSCETPDQDAYLHLAGMDTIVDIYLNGLPIGQHSNALMPLRVDIGGHLQRFNTLALHFHTVFDRSGEDPTPLPVVNNDPARPVRRSNQNYNTYLGPYPYFSRVGVFPPVAVVMPQPGEMEDLTVAARLDTTLDHGQVAISVRGHVSVDGSLDVRLLDERGITVQHVERLLDTEKGSFAVDVSLDVDNPQLWWPRGYGDQNLYALEIELRSQDRVLQAERRLVGFRRIEMPSSLHFTVNGTPVRLWGGNWVSPDWSNAVWDSDRAAHLFDLAANANYNALRVWGVVEPPDDEFYDMADRRGFMVWQDFHLMPFAPGNVNAEICRRESAYTVQRLKHHPSILLWCGGNEAAMWHDAPFGGPGGDWPGKTAAEDVVGSVCRELDPERYYLPNSPYEGIDPNDPLVADTHGYTNIWYVPGYKYLNFASEDTRISAPPLRSLKRFMAQEDIWPDGYSALRLPGREHPWPETWRRYTTSESWKKTGPIHEYYDAADAAALEYQLGTAAGAYYRDTIERQRRGRPPQEQSERRICGGYLVWKFNDSWPEVYSGKVDYFLEPYIAYYAVKRAFAPLLLSFEVDTFIWLWAVNDTMQPVEGTATIRLFHIGDNAVKKKIIRPVVVPPGCSRVIVRLDEAGIGTFRREHMLQADLQDQSGVIVARTSTLAQIERQVAFPDARLSMRIDRGDLVISTDKYAHSVVLHGNDKGDEFGWLFGDNYFDLLPGEEKVVRILGRHHAGTVTARPWYSPHQTTIVWDRQL